MTRTNPRPRPPAQPIRLGVVQRDGTVLLDAAESAFLRDLLASIRVAEVTTHVSAMAVGDGPYVQEARRRQLQALGEVMDPCAFGIVIAPEGDNEQARRDMHTMRTRLAVVSGGIPKWPGREQEKAMARSWCTDAHRLPNGHAFVIETVQQRPEGFEPASPVTVQAVHEQGLRPVKVQQFSGTAGPFR